MLELGQGSHVVNYNHSQEYWQCNAETKLLQVYFSADISRLVHDVQRGKIAITLRRVTQLYYSRQECCPCSSLPYVLQV